MGQFIRQWLSWDRENYIFAQKWLIGHRIDYNGTYLAKINPSTLPLLPGKSSAHFKQFSKSRSFDSWYEIHIESLYRGKPVRLRNMRSFTLSDIAGEYHCSRCKSCTLFLTGDQWYIYMLLQTLWLKALFCLFSSYLKRNARRQINLCSSFAIYNYNYSFSEKIVTGCLLFGSKSPFVLRSFLTNGMKE